MKRAVCLTLIFLILFPIIPVCASRDAVQISARSAILTDAVSGEVIYEKNADERMYPASMTKMMCMLICMEMIKSGQMKYTDKVTITSHAANTGGTQLFLQEGEVRSVDELLYAIMVESANDAAVALGIHIAGSTENFAEIMNQRAAAAGMSGSHFVNACGLHDDDHYTTSRDMAILSRELLCHEDTLRYTSTWTKDLYIGKDNSLLRSLANTNKLISRHAHIDGLKTGYTSHSGHCMSATGKRGDTRLIAVVMDSQNSDERFNDAVKLLDYGFAAYEGTYPVKAGKQYLRAPVPNGETDSVSLISEEDIYVFSEKEDAHLISVETEISREIIQAPVKEGEVLGKISVYRNGSLINSADLVAMEDVEKHSFSQFLKKKIRMILK